MNRYRGLPRGVRHVSDVLRDWARDFHRLLEDAEERGRIARQMNNNLPLPNEKRRPGGQDPTAAEDRSV
jgi:hypothetical protein